MTDTNVSHEDVVNAVRKALLESTEQRDAFGNVLADSVLKLAQSYELASRSGPDQW